MLRISERHTRSSPHVTGELAGDILLNAYRLRSAVDNSHFQMLPTRALNCM